MNKIKKVVASATIMVSSFMLSPHANASAYGVGFIDNKDYTTDTNSGLDWLDVTLSVSQSYNYVSSQFGVRGEYEGWRYATGIELEHMISNWTGIPSMGVFTDRITQPEGAIDGLHFLLGSTLDSSSMVDYGKTFDARFGFEEGEGADSVTGILYDAFDDDWNWFGRIWDGDAPYFDADNGTDFTSVHLSTFHKGTDSYGVGSFLVRDTLTTVPVPAAVWLMGSGLLGLMGYSRKKKSLFSF